ncbi:MAG: hypothetical protein AAGD25_26640 [Cyanobacteria bacterium P01_F01_bin.150]
MGLNDYLGDAAVQENVIADCRQLMDEQVASKKGIGGVAIKAAYKVIKGLGPDYLSKAIAGLLPSICTALDPIWEAGVENGDPVAHMSQNTSQTADAVLSVTDKRIEQSSNKPVKGAYGKLRKSVKSDVEDAIPGLAKIIGTYAKAA